MVRRHHHWKRSVLARLSVTLAIGVVLATASQAFAMSDLSGPRTQESAAAHYTAKALKAMSARWQAEAAFYASRSAHARPDDRSGIRGVAPVAQTTPAAVVRPDDRAGIRGVGPVTDATPVGGGSGIDVRDVSI